MQNTEYRIQNTEISELRVERITINFISSKYYTLDVAGGYISGAKLINDRD